MKAREHARMVSFYIRRMAAIVNAETGRSVQDIVSEIANAIQSGVVDYRSRCCPLCGSRQTITTSTRGAISVHGCETIVRHHKCGFCGIVFHSHEKKTIQNTDELSKAIVKPGKKSHIKKRGA